MDPGAAAASGPFPLETVANPQESEPQNPDLGTDDLSLLAAEAENQKRAASAPAS